MFICCRRQCQLGHFENTSTWLSDLENSINATGLKLFSNYTESSHMFFADKLLNELEEVSIQLTICGSPLKRGWAASQFLRFNSFTHATLVDMYVRLLEQWIGSPTEKMIQIISSLTFVLSKWVNLINE